MKKFHRLRRSRSPYENAGIEVARVLAYLNRTGFSCNPR
jgi:hypothetical protein